MSQRPGPHVSEPHTMGTALAAFGPAMRDPERAGPALADLLGVVVSSLPGVEAASVVTRRQAPRILAVSDAMAAVAEQAQRLAAVGPGYDCIAEHRTCSMVDVPADLRWPAYSTRVQTGSPIRSLVAIPLAAPEAAGLTLYSTGLDTFTGSLLPAAHALAAHVSTLIALFEASELAANLRIALDTNRRISVAVGVLMARLSLDADGAYGLLRHTSQRLNRKLSEIADEVATAGGLPDHPVQ